MEISVKDMFDSNTMDLDAYNSGGILFSANGGEKNCVTVAVDLSDLRKLYDYIGHHLNVQGALTPEEPVPVEKVDTTHLTGEILELSGIYPLTHAGQYVLVNNNALRFIEEVKKLLDGAL